MPFHHPKNIGTNADKSRSADYCIRCYKDGAFREFFLEPVRKLK